MRKLFLKLKNKTGETMAEVLIALLIAALSMSLLAAMVSSATSMVSRSGETLNRYYAASNRLAVQATPAGTSGPSGSGKFSLKYVGEVDTFSFGLVNAENSSTVNYWQNTEADTVMSYRTTDRD